ncbi:hypothetical protein [Dyadobacter frigoris]|uniref:Porin family protein n=1 Tax=Dyadobacter frigoris TaxID=2576211 RepID=A0A4U6DDC9_9BACT|nr:hypothetical protein [Dyadobacter frigoris]TKT92424.1 hypothetical protein FDK13_10655 [Dyadobacter frigoris]GLU53616.1 hypothetical protein Dfri01_30770 [Dyadobacter frigoris]
MKKTLSSLTVLCCLLSGYFSYSQQVQTVFSGSKIKRSGGYAAISNKFTTINGDFANMPEIYGGWFVNSKFLIGAELAATTNFIPSPNFNNSPDKKITYQYGQFGLMTEYIFASNKRVHFAVNLINGAGFTLQYDRKNWDDWDNDDWNDNHTDAKFFYAIEPGAQVEINLLKWMRLSPGISYRKTFGAKGNGLTDGDLSNISYNMTLKFGRF